MKAHHSCARPSASSRASSDGVREGYAVLGLVCGVAGRDFLVASAGVGLLVADVHAAGDIGALLVEAHNDFAVLVAQGLAVDQQAKQSE